PPSARYRKVPSHATRYQANGREENMPRLSGRRILITGGASGIGRATCELFEREGAAVAVFDRVPAADDSTFSVTGDVSDPASVTNAVQQSAQALGGLDGLVNAAGVFFNKGL